jgi:hypothetical protein
MLCTTDTACTAQRLEDQQCVIRPLTQLAFGSDLFIEFLRVEPFPASLPTVWPYT